MVLIQEHVQHITIPTAITRTIDV